jgi:hypothetical protein
MALGEDAPAEVELIPSVSLADAPPELVRKALDRFAAEGVEAEIGNLLAIHRAPDGLIIFERKIQEADGIRWERIGAFRPDSLNSYLPGLAPFLTDDAYATVNGYDRTWRQPSASGFPTASRKESNLKYLNACYADIDCGRTGEPLDPKNPNKHLPPELCVAAVLALAKRGEIPYPSMLAFSGRGLYLFWLLRDETDPTMPARSYSAARVAFYKQVNRALHERLAIANLPIDRGAHDAARVLRVPGSLHSTAGKSAEYTAALFSNTRNPSGTYTLGELADLVGAKAIANTTKAIGYEAPKTGLRNPNKREGYRAQANYAAEDIDAIFQHQGGFKHGKRRKALTIYATFLKQAGESKPDALKACRLLAANCEPSYPDLPADDKTSPSVAEIVNAAWATRRKRYKRALLADFFDVTPAMAKDLELRSIVPAIVKTMRANARQLANRKTAREIRRRHISHYLTEYPTASAREVFRALTRKGIATNPQTVNEDMNALGHKRLPGSPGRPRKNPYPDKVGK